MPQPLPRRGHVAVCGLVLAVALAVGWPLGAVSNADDLDLEVEAIGDGIERIWADGVGHRFDRRSVRDLAIAADGTVWVVQGRRTIALGQPGSVRPRSDRWRHYVRRLEPTPDGGLWAVEDGGAVVSLEGDTFEDRSGGWRGAGNSLAAFADGEVWRTVRGEDGRALVVSSVDGQHWNEVPTDGLESLLGPHAARHTLARTDDGRTWLGVDRGPRGGGLVVFDGAGWRPLDVAAETGDLRVRAMAPGHDGSLWVLAEQGEPGPQSRHVLVRIHEGRSYVFGEDQGMPQYRSLAWIGWSPLEPAALTVDDSGRVWFSTTSNGLWTFDGAHFERIEPTTLRHGAMDLAVAPDGDVWIVSRTARLYRISPPAAAADIGRAGWEDTGRFAELMARVRDETCANEMTTVVH